MSPYRAKALIRRAWHGALWRLFPPRHLATEDDKELGRCGERAAARFLKTRGYGILVRGFRSRYGEIDLVCRDCETLVFVEVKSRARAGATRPSDAVQAEKQKHLSRAALDYLRRLGNPAVPARFDVVEVLWAEPQPSFNLIQGAFALAEPYRY